MDDKTYTLKSNFTLEEVGKQLRLLRKQRSLTIEELSKKADLSIGTISNIETRKRILLSLENIEMLYSVLGYDIGFVVTKKENEPFVYGEEGEQ